MDAEHQANLQRILTNRKLRGASAKNMGSMNGDPLASTARPSQEGSPVRSSPTAAEAAPSGHQQQPYRTYSNIPVVESQVYDPAPPRSAAPSSASSPYIVPASGTRYQDVEPVGRSQPQQQSFANRPTAQPQPKPSNAAASDEQFMGRIGSMLNVEPTAASRRSGSAQPYYHQPSVSVQRSADETSAGTGLNATPGSQAGSLARDPDDRGAGLFKKGLFDNFREKPLLVTPKVHPYRNDDNATVRRTMTTRMRSASPGGRSRSIPPPPNTKHNAKEDVKRGGTLTVADAPVNSVTQPNPFRTQTFEQFLVNPDDSQPKEVEAILAAKHASQLPAARNNKQERLAPPFRTLDRGAPSADFGSPRAPLHGLRDVVKALQHGDWFLKWTRNKDKIHQRYFWLDDTCSILYWSKAPHANVVFASSIRITEISDLQTKTISDPATGRTMHVLVIWSVSRVAQIGTELREKFNLWFDGLRRLSTHHREHNAAFYSRHATMQPVRSTAVYGRMVAQSPAE